MMSELLPFVIVIAVTAAIRAALGILTDMFENE